MKQKSKSMSAFNKRSFHEVIEELARETAEAFLVNCRPDPRHHVQAGDLVELVDRWAEMTGLHGATLAATVIAVARELWFPVRDHIPGEGFVVRLDPKAVEIGIRQRDLDRLRQQIEDVTRRAA
jgi:hypothetical protein